MALFLSGNASSAAQETRDNEHFLFGVLLKTWTLRERTVADIRMNDQELQANDLIVREAERKMSIAVETYNPRAISAARGPLEKARADRRKIKQDRARLDLARTRAESSSAAVRNLLVSGQGRGSNSLIRGLASLRSGKVEIFRKDGKKVALDGSRPRFLEPGDEMVTMSGSSAEIQVLDGRAVVQLDEHSRLKLEEESPQELVLRLLQGRIYSAVDKVDDFAVMLQDNAGSLEADQELKEFVARIGERIMGWTDKKFTVRTPSACCSVSGTEFAVGLISSGGTEIAIFGGAVDVGVADCARQVPVGQDFKVIVTKKGISEPQKVADIDKWWEK